MNVGRCYLYGIGTVSALGFGRAEAESAFQKNEAVFSLREFGKESLPVGALSDSAEAQVRSALFESARYRALDRTSHLAILSAREAIEHAEWNSEDGIGVMIGSSRGATSALEQAHAEFLKSGTVPVPTSPQTTLGSVASWVAQDLMLSGPAISHSVTCSTALYALGTGLAWIRAGMASRFLVGGSEASLTPFTIAQMRALRIYSSLGSERFPCRPCGDWEGKKPQNTFVLGEGACVMAMGSERETGNPIARIDAFGCAIEEIDSSTSISEEGAGLKQAMRRALLQLEPGSYPDLIVLHSPGTLKGDEAELSAVRALFGDDIPMLASPKWICGHTFGAAGAMGVLYALFCLSRGEMSAIPYPCRIKNRFRPVRRVMINAAGFGGNAASVVLSLPK